MPLRDHFRTPTDLRFSWEELHGQWPGVIVQDVRRVLPPGYSAGPKVHHGAVVEVDVSAYEFDEAPRYDPASAAGGLATAWAPAEPSVAVETELTDYDEYEVRIYDARHRRQLVAAVEIVSPANKDRPQKRNDFLGKCAYLLKQGVAVSIVDVVTVMHFNLYADLLEFIGHPNADRAMGTDPPTTYAASCRWVEVGRKTILQAWSHPLRVGQPLPTLPLWLAPGLVVPLDLDATYERACGDLGVV
jgi:hypothetical protein